VLRRSRAARRQITRNFNILNARIERKAPQSTFSGHARWILRRKKKQRKKWQTRHNR
jgi:hypothetical protein